MVGEKLSDEFLDTILEALPVDITVIDGDDRIVGWTKHETRMFKRAESVLGKDVRSCHHESSLPAIESLLRQLKSGEKEKVEFRIDGPAKPGSEKCVIWVVYSALRNGSGTYLGCLETTRIVYGS